MYPCPAWHCFPACRLCCAWLGQQQAAVGSGSLLPRPVLSCSSWGRRAAAQPVSDGEGWERLVPALGWSMAAVPRGHSTGVGTTESPYVHCSLAWRGRTGRLEQCLKHRSTLQPFCCCTFSCSPPGALRSGAGTVLCCVERPPLRATSMGIAGLLLVGFGASFPSPGDFGDLLLV